MPMFLNSSRVNYVDAYSKQGWERLSMSLPDSINNHFMTMINSTSVMVIGGKSNSNGILNKYLHSSQLEHKLDNWPSPSNWTSWTDMWKNQVSKFM